MTFPKVKLAQLEIALVTLRLELGKTRPDELANALNCVGDALGEMAEFLDGLNLERRNERKPR